MLRPVHADGLYGAVAVARYFLFTFPGVFSTSCGKSYCNVWRDPVSLHWSRACCCSVWMVCYNGIEGSIVLGKGCCALVMGFGSCVEVWSSLGHSGDNGIVCDVFCELTGGGNRCLVGTCRYRNFGLDGILLSVHGQRSLSFNRVKESVILVRQQCARTHFLGLFRARTPHCTLHLAHVCVVLLLQRHAVHVSALGSANQLVSVK